MNGARFAGGQGSAGKAAAAFSLAVGGAALLTALGAFALMLSITDDGHGPPATQFPGLALIVFAKAAVVIAAVAAIVGLPLTRFLARSRRERPSSYPLAGLAAGAALALAFAVATAEPHHPLYRFLAFAATGALPGCVCGTIWWLAYRRHERESGDERG